MIRYLARRVGQSLLTIFLTVSTVFVLVRLALRVRRRRRAAMRESG